MQLKQAPQLPFDTAPKERTITLGNERVGTLTFPVYGDLTVNEQSWLVANGAEKTAFSFTSTCALKISRLESIEPIVAHNFVARVLAAAMQTPVDLSDEEQAWMVKYVRDLEECAIKVLEVTTQAQNALVTCVIRHRLPGMEKWTLSDTTGLASELVDEITKFAQIEQARGEFESVEEQTEALREMLGKQLKESSTTTPASSTGEPSTTSSETSTPETPTSAENDSDGSPANMSPTV